MKFQLPRAVLKIRAYETPDLLLNKIAEKSYHEQQIEAGRWLRRQLHSAQEAGIKPDVLLLVLLGAVREFGNALHAEDPLRELERYYNEY